MSEANRVLRIERGSARVVQLEMPTPKDGFVLVKQHIAPNCIEHRIYETGFYEFHESPVHEGALARLFYLIEHRR